MGRHPILWYLTKPWHSQLVNIRNTLFIIHLNLLAVIVDFLKLAQVVLIESAGDIHESIFEHFVVLSSVFFHVFILHQFAGGAEVALDEFLVFPVVSFFINLTFSHFSVEGIDQRIIA